MKTGLDSEFFICYAWMLFEVVVFDVAVFNNVSGK